MNPTITFTISASGEPDLEHPTPPGKIDSGLVRERSLFRVP
jgi:hypothetical protein